MERCPQCGRVVDGFFSHVDIECQDAATDDDLAAMLAEAKEPSYAALAVEAVGSTMTPREFLAGPAVEYSGWFGTRNSHRDYAEAVEVHGEPLEVSRHDRMLCLVYADRIVVVGYNDEEWWQSWEFPRRAP